MQERHVLIVTLTVSEVMHTRIMDEQIDRVQIVGRDTIQHQDRILLVSNVPICQMILKPIILRMGITTTVSEIVNLHTEK